MMLIVQNNVPPAGTTTAPPVVQLADVPAAPPSSTPCGCMKRFKESSKFEKEVTVANALSIFFLVLLCVYFLKKIFS